MRNFCWEREELSDHLFEYFYLFRKYFSFVVNFVKSSKLEAQHDIHKIYLHVIETPPSKLETLKCVEREKRELSDYLFEYFYPFRKYFGFAVNFVKSG